MDDAAPGVDHGAALCGDQPLPGVPATTLDQGQLNRVTEAGLDDRVRIEEEQELVRGGARTGVAGGAEAEVRPQLEQLGACCELADALAGAVGGGVVADDQLVAGTQLGRDRRQRAADLVRRFVGDDDDRELDGLRGGLAQKTR